MSVEAKVRNIIVTAVHTVGPRATISEAAKIMVENDVGCLMVFGSGRP